MPVPKNPTCAPPAQDKAPLNVGYIWMISFVAALGGLLFGWDWVVIGGAKPFFEPYFDLPAIARQWGHHSLARMLGLTSEATLSGWANSCALLGCLAGSLLAGGLSDRFGRKKLLVFSAFVFAASSLLTGWAASFNQFILWRILGGVAIGMASNLSPLYIAEIAPAWLRGRLVTLNQLTIVFGILAAQLLNMLIAQKVPDGRPPPAIAASWNGQYGWRWMFTLVAAPSLLFFCSALFVPESPRWLVKNGQDESGPARPGAHRRRQLTPRWKPPASKRPLPPRKSPACALPDLLEPRMIRILLIGCAPGRAATVERHQRPVQLRREHFQTGRLRREHHPAVHRDYRASSTWPLPSSPWRRWTAGAAAA